MIAVCLKWVDRRPEVDSLTGAVHADARSAGTSDADQAALEWALRTSDAWGMEVVAITAGPPAADSVLRDALAAGVARAIRVDVAIGAPSETVAAALAAHLAGSDVVWCGDVSFDRGSGAVPAYLAAHLGAAQALGLVAVEIGTATSMTVLRRLDGGRRERLRLTAPAVCSVEGSTTRLRRAPLAATLKARTATIESRTGSTIAERVAILLPVAVGPYRPRPRVLPAPHGASVLERIVALTAAPSGAAHGHPVALEPGPAADRILETLRSWGYGDG